jgi:hypothetical protein
VKVLACAACGAAGGVGWKAGLGSWLSGAAGLFRRPHLGKGAQQQQVVELGVGNAVAAFSEFGEVLAGQAHWSLLRVIQSWANSSSASFSSGAPMLTRAPSVP